VLAQPSPLPDEAVVAAARGGDRSAVDELAHRYLPMVYHLVRQAMPDDPAVDDVVQDIMVRALRQLPALRSPGSFRPWLAAVAVHQIGSHLARQNLATGRTTPLDTTADRPDPDAELEGPALLRIELAAQRRQVGHATRWMNTTERTSFSLWWLETTGELTRAQVAAALGTSVAHAGVRIQRMREQLQTSRQIVAALEAIPGCDRLEQATADWDATPSPYWRKRLGRHVQSCPTCAHTTQTLLPAERLLTGLLLLPVPAALTTAVIAKTLTTAPTTAPTAAAVTSNVASWLGRAAQATAAHPLAATITAGVLAVSITLPTTGWTLTTPPTRTTNPAASTPNTPTTPLHTGRLSLESATTPGHFIAVAGDTGILTPLTPTSDPAARERASLQAVPGLADPTCFSLKRPDGRYLRHSSFRLRLNPDDGTVLFRQDATFCPHTGFHPHSISLESFNYQNFYLRHINNQMWIDKNDGSPQFQADSSYLIRPPLA
jgi:RNA polymerase sigma factor (sigma-70 family)